MKIELSDRNIKQAEVPEICEVLPNRNGSAPAMVFRKEDKIIISLPGVPFEMKTIVQEEVIPLLNKAFQLPVRIQKTVLTVGIPESTMADRLKSWGTGELASLSSLWSVGFAELASSVDEMTNFDL
ncbi:putative competence-damage inducible protein [subsurface metagenome]